MFCRQLRPADHLQVKSWMFCKSYYHHGIFVGPEDGVAHFTALDINKSNAEVRLDDISFFEGTKMLIRIKYDTCLPCAETTANALNHVNNPQSFGRYNLITNNCEHFATKCKTGIKQSLQIERIIHISILDHIRFFLKNNKFIKRVARYIFVTRLIMRTSLLLWI